MSKVAAMQALWLQRSALGLAAALQLGCAVVFISDVIEEWPQRSTHTLVEAVAVVGLLFGAGLAIKEMRKMARRNARVELELRAASGALQAVIEGHFDTWGLTRAERDVALLSIKGMSNAEIARLRDTREGTIKAQATAIYRKAGVSSRAELISAVIEDLIGGLSLIDAAPQTGEKTPP